MLWEIRQGLPAMHQITKRAHTSESQQTQEI